MKLFSISPFWVSGAEMTHLQQKKNEFCWHLALLFGAIPFLLSSALYFLYRVKPCTRDKSGFDAGFSQVCFWWDFNVANEGCQYVFAFQLNQLYQLLLCSDLFTSETFWMAVKVLCEMSHAKFVILSEFTRQIFMAWQSYIGLLRGRGRRF